ncbi:hypothetical protein DN555_27205 [Enterobacter asburiae]|nr:hypothetical protein DN555_27205 [Enterobacter asburiae]
MSRCLTWTQALNVTEFQLRAAVRSIGVKSTSR